MLAGSFFLCCFWKSCTMKISRAGLFYKCWHLVHSYCSDITQVIFLKTTVMSIQFCNRIYFNIRQKHCGVKIRQGICLPNKRTLYVSKPESDCSVVPVLKIPKCERRHLNSASLHKKAAARDVQYLCCISSFVSTFLAHFWKHCRNKARQTDFPCQWTFLWRYNFHNSLVQIIWAVVGGWIPLIICFSLLLLKWNVYNIWGCWKGGSSYCIPLQAALLLQGHLSARNSVNAF